MVSTNSSASSGEAMAISSATRLKATSMEMPDSTQIKRRSSASGQARRMECCRLAMALATKMFGA
ncbi:hypothetical protein D9M70_640710 [compost metagenome]